MSLDTAILQGRFTSDGNDKTLQLRSDVDWMWVYNATEINDTRDVGLYYYWQRGQADGTGFIWSGADADNHVVVDQLGAGDGFTPIDTSGAPLSVSVATTASTNATQPVVSTANTTGLVTGSVIRYYTPAASAVRQLGGIDFEIDTVVANTSFRFRYALATAPAVGGAGSYRIVKFDPLFYPRHRYIANITQAANAVITTTVSHGFTVGQKVRIFLSNKSRPVASNPYGMIEIHERLATVTAVTASTITTDIDSSTFTAFTFPLNADYPFSPAIVTPVGEAAESPYENLLDDATDNQGYIGMILAGGESKPGGANGDVMYWRAGKSFSVDNE